MNITYPSRNLLVILAEGKTAVKLLLQSATEYAARYPLYLIDSFPRVNASYADLELYFQSKEREDPIQTIYRASAYTCLQMTDMLVSMCKGIQPMRAVYILDILSTYYDEAVPYNEAKTLLDYSLDCLQAISRLYPVVVTSSLPADSSHARKSFLVQLCRNATHVVNEGFEEIDYLDLIGG